MARLSIFAWHAFLFVATNMIRLNGNTMNYNNFLPDANYSLMFHNYCRRQIYGFRNKTVRNEVIKTHFIFHFMFRSTLFSRKRYESILTLQ